MSDPFVGEIVMFGGNFAIRNYAFCNGQLLSIATNTALFSLLGTTYGGDGRTTFGLPNLQGRVPIGWGQGAGLSNRRIGDSSGSDTVTLTTSQLPAHTHTPAAGSPVPATDDDPGTGAILGTTVGGNTYAAAANLTPMADEAILPAGGGQAHNNLQPFLAVNYLIALQGVYPSRS